MKKFFKLGCMGFIGLIVLIVVVAMFGGGDGESGAQKVSTSENITDTTTSDETNREESAVPSVFKVGDTVKLGDAEITLDSVQFVDANEYAPSEKGKVLSVAFTTKNNGNEQLYFGAEEMSISSSDGVQHEQYFGADDLFINENINPGKTIKGTIYYDVTEDTTYEIIYTPTFTFDDDTITFEIQL